MHLTLLESDRSFLHSAECAALSIMAHLGVVWWAMASTDGTFKLPVTEREARILFLLPPDRVPASERTSELPQVGKLASGLGESQVPDAGEGMHLQAAVTRNTRRKGKHSGPRLADLAVSPTPYMPDSVFSVLEVDQMVERYESSAAPVYPPELVQKGTEGRVDATYVVDTTGRVDTTTFQVLQSDDSLFTRSVRTALAEARFRPAKRAGKPVRQLVAQRFRFKIAPPGRPLDPGS